MIRHVDAKIRPHRAAFLAAFCFFVLAVLYGAINPPFESFDEEQHYLFVKQLADRTGLPVREITPILKETHQAPLYYALAALATFYVDTRDVDLTQRGNPFGLSLGSDRPADNHNKLLHGPWEAFPWRGTVLSAHIARLLSAVLGTLTVLLTYFLAREVFPRRKDVPLLAAVGIAINVQFTYISSAISNDVLVACLSAATLVPLMRTIRLGLGIRRSLLIGALVGLAALSKASGIMLLPVALLVLLLATARSRDWRKGLRCVLWLVLTAAAVCAWWYVRNKLIYDDWFGLRNVYLSGAGRPVELAVIDALAQLGATARSFYLPWAWTHFGVPEPIYILTLSILGLGMLGAMGGLTERTLRLVSEGLLRKDRRQLSPSETRDAHWAGESGPPGTAGVLARTQVAAGEDIRGPGIDASTPSQDSVHHASGEESTGRPRIYPETGSMRSLVGQLLADTTLLQLVILLAWGALSVTAVVRYIQVSINAEGGRFLFPAISALYVVMAWGWLRLIPLRVSRFLPLGLGTSGLLWSFAYLWLFLVPSYAPPPLLGPAALDAVPRRVNAHLDGQLAFVGHDPLPNTARPGDILSIGVYWQSLGNIDHDYSVFVHLADRGGGNVSQKDTYAGLGNFSTSAWRPGDAFQDVYRLHIPDNLPAPQLLDVIVGMYLREPDADVIFTFDDGREPASAIHLGQVKLLPHLPILPEAQNPTQIVFGDSLRLGSFTVQQVQRENRDHLSLTLIWQALRAPDSDYTVFVHVLDEADRIVAQTDEQPKRGRFPTSYWEKDQVVDDQHDVTLPRLQPGDYRVLVGLADERARVRLQGVSSSTPILHSAAIVAKFSVESR